MADRRPDGSGGGGPARLLSIRYSRSRQASRRTTGRSTWWTNTGDELWRIDDPTTPGAAVLEGSFPSGIGTRPASRRTAGSLYVVDAGSRADQLWRVDDPTSPGSAVKKATFHPGSRSRRASRRTTGRSTWWTSNGDELWRIDDPTAPGSAGHGRFTFHPVSRTRQASSVSENHPA